MILLIDNYDNQTSLLYQYISLLGKEILVVHGDVTITEIELMGPESIVISTGLGLPMGICDIILSFGPRISILGVCLGHQLIGLTYGGSLERCSSPVFGRASLIYHDGKGFLSGMSNPFWAMRNHTHVISTGTLPECLEVSAWTQDGTIMGLRHRYHSVEGVQFHLSPVTVDVGRNIIRDFVREKKEAFR